MDNSESGEVKNISRPKTIPVKVSELLLDIENPRILAPMNNQDDIRAYLLEYEDVTQLAQKINEVGILPGDVLVVIEEGGEYIVMEGNRRTAAMQMMLDRNLIPSGHTGIPYIDQEIRSLIEIQDVHLVDSRLTAERMMATKHIDGVKRWKTLAKQNFFHTRYEKGATIKQLSDQTGISASEVRKHVRHYKLFMDTYSGYKQDHPDFVLDVTKVKVDPFVRPFTILTNYNGATIPAADLLEMTFDDREKAISSLGEENFKDIKLQVFKEAIVLGKVSTRMNLLEIEGVKALVDKALSGTPPGGNGTGGSGSPGTGGTPSGGNGSGSGGGTSSGNGTGGSGSPGTGGTPSGGNGSGSGGKPGGSKPGSFFEIVKWYNLDECNAQHAGLHCVVSELFSMSRGSPKLYTKNPIAAGLLVRSAYEQSIKLLMVSTGNWNYTGFTQLKKMESDMNHWLDSGKIKASDKLKGAFKQVYVSSHREFLNNNVHDPEYIRATPGRLEDMALGGMLAFVQEVINSLPERPHN